MNAGLLVNGIDKHIFSRQDIFASASRIQSDFRETQLRNLIGCLLETNIIVRIGRNQYQRSDDLGKIEYVNTYSQECLDLIQSLQDHYPNMEYCVWELSWLNEFLNHLLSQNRIFVEVDKERCEYVFSYLTEDHSRKVLLKPSEKEIEYYCSDNCIIIDRLISEAPRGKSAENRVPIEKIIVDLFANRNLQYILSKSDYPDMLERIFDTYIVDWAKLFRYARRRNKQEEITSFIKKNTNIDLTMGV